LVEEIFEGFTESKVVGKDGHKDDEKGEEYLFNR